MKQILTFAIACLFSMSVFAQTEEPDSVTNTVQVTEIMIVPGPDNVKINGKDTEVHEYVDVLPEYPGGDKALMTFISQNIEYPATAIENGVQGRVLVKFVVTPKGNVANTEVIESVSPELDAEALRVVNLLKGWKPGEYDGKKVFVWYTLPISFNLQGDVEDFEAFDAVDIDSIGYREMMDYGLKAEAEKNYPHARAYFKEAFHINPYDLVPVEKIEAINNAEGKQSDNLELYKWADNELTVWNLSNGFGNSAIPTMETICRKIVELNPDEVQARMDLIGTYLGIPTEENVAKGATLMDETIPIALKAGPIEQAAATVSIRANIMLALNEYDAIIGLVEPLVDRIGNLQRGVGALIALSNAYNAKGDKTKADKYMQMAKDADPTGEAMKQWL